MGKNRCRRLLVVLLCWVCLLWAGCENPAVQESSEESAAGAVEVSSVIESAAESSEESAYEVVPSDGILRMTVFMPETLNPLSVQQPEVAQLLLMIFMPLVETDENGAAVEGGLAEEWEVLSDGYQLRLKIRSDVLWQDGTSVSAQDVVYTLQAFLEESADHYWKAQLSSITEVALDENGDVRITFSVPVDVDHLGMLVVPILPEHIYHVENPPEWEPIGNGPYQVTEYRAMRKIRLTANAQYVGNTPQIQEILIEITRSEDAEESAFSQGLTHIIYEEMPSSLSAENIEHHTVYRTDTHELQLLYMNQREGSVLAEENVRKAIMHCIDAQELIDRTQIHQGTCSQSVIPSWIADCSLPETYPIDYQLAYSLLGENRGASLRLIVSREEQTAIAQARLIYEQLSQIGLDVQVVLYDEADWQKALEEGEFDLAFGSCRIDSIQDLSELLASEGAGNYSGRQDAEMDRLLQNASSAVGEEARTAAYQALAEYAWETLPVCPLYYSQQAVVVSRDLGGELSPTPYHLYRGIENLLFTSET